jgi:hypothetical protein
MRRSSSLVPSFGSPTGAEPKSDSSSFFNASNNSTMASSGLLQRPSVDAPPMTPPRLAEASASAKLPSVHGLRRSGSGARDAASERVLEGQAGRSSSWFSYLFGGQPRGSEVGSKGMNGGLGAVEDGDAKVAARLKQLVCASEALITAVTLHTCTQLSQHSQDV